MCRLAYIEVRNPNKKSVEVVARLLDALELSNGGHGNSITPLDGTIGANPQYKPLRTKSAGDYKVYHYPPLYDRKVQTKGRRWRVWVPIIRNLRVFVFHTRIATSGTRENLHPAIEGDWLLWHNGVVFWRDGIEVLYKRIRGNDWDTGITAMLLARLARNEHDAGAFLRELSHTHIAFNRKTKKIVFAKHSGDLVEFSGKFGRSEVYGIASEAPLPQFKAREVQYNSYGVIQAGEYGGKIEWHTASSSYLSSGAGSYGRYSYSERDDIWEYYYGRYYDRAHEEADSANSGDSSQKIIDGKPGKLYLYPTLGTVAFTFPDPITGEVTYKEFSARLTPRIMRSLQVYWPAVDVAGIDIVSLFRRLEAIDLLIAGAIKVMETVYRVRPESDVDIIPAFYVNPESGIIEYGVEVSSAHLVDYIPVGDNETSETLAEKILMSGVI